YAATSVRAAIWTGATTPLQTLVRPRLAADPYATGIPGVYICSAATPPGPGAHGMCGYGAARSALRRLELSYPRRRGAAPRWRPARGSGGPRRRRGRTR